ncbi:sensor histidine kinase [Streptomyces sp. WAC05374]|uniref:sensor histidine kinase n=1 Tax=Streptomyces sp. WAC05374 TaxID=2487420 RepID=UPI001F40116D|nr:histidine kinase [Streptomyces sp. WAC05374]
MVVVSAVPGAIRALSGVDRRLARQMLGPATSHQRVRRLEAARATPLADNTDQLRRLERDLHDGTQARLVALAITLSLAEDALSPATGPEPGRLRTLVDRARGQTEDTITELRRLTRGIHPVALDGGLEEALPGLTATSPVPVTVRVDVPKRPHQAVERAVYFCAAELLTNVAKHSGAHAAELTATTADGRIRLIVRDDGRGHIGPVPFHFGEQVRCRPGSRHHLASAGSEQLDHPATQNDGVFGQHDAQALIDHEAMIGPGKRARGPGEASRPADTSQVPVQHLSRH